MERNAQNRTGNAPARAKPCGGCLLCSGIGSWRPGEARKPRTSGASKCSSPASGRVTRFCVT